MQTHGGSAAEAAILSSERHLRAKLLVDWNRNGLFDHDLSDMSQFEPVLSTDRALQGSAPAELFLIEGSSAAELSFTVGGEYNGLRLVEVFSLFNLASPFYMEELIGAEVTWELGVDTALGTVWYPQFKGYIQTIEPDRGSDEVSFTALDRVETMRKNVSLSKWTALEEWDGIADQNQMAESQAVVDSVLRMCDVSATPYRPPYHSELGLELDNLTEGCMFWLTANGWDVPTIGWSEAPLSRGSYHDSYFPDGMYVENGEPHPDSSDPTIKPLSFRPAGAGSSDELGFAVDGIYQLNNVVGTSGLRTHYLGFTLDTSSTDWDYHINQVGTTNLLTVHVDETVNMRLESVSGQLRASVQGTNGTVSTSLVSIPAGADTQRGYIIFDNSSPTGCRVYIKIGTNDNGGFQALGVPRTAGTGHTIKGRVQVFRHAGFSDVGYTALNVSGPDTTDKSTGLAARPAVLTRSINRLSHIPDRAGVNAWDLTKQIAEAELASVFWDEAGGFRFWSYQKMLDLQVSPVRELTLDHVSNLRLTFDLGSIRNVWSVKTERKRAKHFKLLYDHSDPDGIIVSPSSTADFRLSGPTYDSIQNGALTRFGTTGALPAWDTNPNITPQGYVAQWSVTGTGAWAEDNAQPAPTVIPYQAPDGTITLRVVNTSTRFLRFATDATQGALRFVGGIVESAPDLIEETRDDFSVSRYGVRTLTIDGDWVQDPYQSTELISTLLPRTSRPIPVTDSITIAGDPRLQLGDSVTIQDPQGFGTDLNAQIYGIRRDFSPSSGLTDTLTIEVALPTRPGIWDSSQLGRWDETFTWS